MMRALLPWALVPLVFAGCGDDAAPEDGGVPDAAASLDATAPPSDSGPRDSAPPRCGTAAGALPTGVETLSYFDDASMRGRLDGETWSIDVGGGPHVLADEVAFEQARFQLDRPARIYGFAVQWASLPPTAPADLELEAGLYPDFGHNGFDMWRFDPYWTGTRCAGDLPVDGWLEYVFDAPVEIDQPGLVYVGHRHGGAGEPGWRFDTSTDADGDCTAFTSCRSSLNLPNAEAGRFFNGVTIQIPYDYIVRLYVEYTDEVAPDATVFRELSGTDAGRRTSFGDYDEDGWDDFVTNGPRLMHNAGDGTFTDATAGSGIAAMGISGAGGVWGDYDNDGCLDLFVFSDSMTASDTLLHSECDGTFSDVTAAAGITDVQGYEDCGDPARVHAPSPAAAWVDLDADGALDLYVANFICWDLGTYYVDSVFHNRGDGTFEDWSGTRGFSSARQASRGAAPIDADRDGDVDMLVNTYRLQRNLFFDNQGDGTFIDDAQAKHLSGNPSYAGGVAFGHTIGAAWGDLDNDGDFDVVQANLAHPRFFRFSDKTQVLINDGAGDFMDNSGDWSFPASANGLRYQETHSSPVLADFDQDGVLDLVITAIYDGRPTDFYWGNGDGTFRLDVLHAGITTQNGWGAAVSDWDHDGDMDLAAQTLFENRAAPIGHWLQVRVVGNVRANRAAIGATVEVQAAGVTRIRHVQGGSGQGCQDSMYLHFGLGAATRVDSIRVELPGGTTVSYAGPFDADQRVWLFEDGTTHLGWAPPTRR